MKKEEKQAKAAEEPPPTPPDESPQFSREFMSAMGTYAYNTLHDYLTAQKVPVEALALLDDMMILHTIVEVYAEKERALYIWNEEACNVIADISQKVPLLGGKFLTPMGQTAGRS